MEWESALILKSPLQCNVHVCFRSLDKFSFSLCCTLEHTNIFSTDMCIETPPQSSVSALSTAEVSGVVIGSLIILSLAFGTGFGLGILCVQFWNKFKQTTGTLIIIIILCVNHSTECE